MAVTRNVTRTARARTTQIRGSTNSTSQNISQRIKARQAQAKSDTEFQTNFSADITPYIINSASLADAQTKANSLMSTQIASLEPRLRIQASASIQRALNTLKSKQNAYIQDLQAQIKSAESKAKLYKTRWSKNYKNKSTTWKEKQVTKETKADLLKQTLKEVQSGKVLDISATQKNISSLASQAGTQARKQDFRSIAGIRASSKLSTQNKIERDNAIDDIAIQVAKGATATDMQLKELGLTSQEISKVRAVEELEGKRKESLLSTYKTSLDTSLFTAKGAKFDKLSQSDKDLVNTYNTLKEIKDNAYNVISLKDYSSYGVGKISDKATTKQVLNIIDSYNLPVKDKAQLRDIAKLSDTQLKKALLQNKPIANNSIASYNRILDKYQKNQDKLYSDSLKTLKQKYALKTVGNIAGNVAPVKTIYLASVIKYLESEQKKNNPITYEQVEAFVDASNKWNTLSVWKRELDSKGKYNPQRSILENKLITTKLTLNFFKSVAIETALEVQRTANFLWTLAKQAPKFSWKVTKSTGKIAWETYQDTTKLLASKINKLSKAEQKKIFARTAKRIEAIRKVAKSTADFTKKVISNPKTYWGILVLAGASAIAMGYSGAKKIITNNPAKALGFLSSFIVEAYLTGGIIKGAKLLKATLSPLVIKGVTVFDGASIRGSAKALKALQGKKINLFSSTSSDLRKIFKGTEISKADELKLIKDMLKNPEIYIGSNFKIKPLSQIATSSTKRTMLQFMKNTKNGILSGSGALKLQLKSFRKVGDFDIIAKNAKSYSSNLAKYLNDSILGRAFKKTRFGVYGSNGVFTIYDTAYIRKIPKIIKGMSRAKQKSVITARRLFLKKYGIADIVDLRRAVTNFGRKITKADVRLIEGIRVFKAESQIPIKAGLVSDPLFSFRTGKETKDLKLLLKKAKELLSKKKYTRLRNFLEENTEFLKVKAFADQVGTDRRFSWAKKYFPDLNLPFSRNSKIESAIRRRLKKIGFTDRMIDDNIRLFTPTDFYFAPNTVYTEYLRGSKKGGIIFAKNVKISSYPKNLQSLINKNIKGSLSIKEQAKLRGALRKWRLKNPNKAFVGEKALADGFGEIEILSPEYTKLFPRNTLLKREIYIPSLESFVRAQEVTLGKAPKPVLKAFATALKSKLKKGYKFSDAVKDIKKLASTKLKAYGKYLKGLVVPNKAEKKALSELLKSLDNQEDLIKTARRAKKITKSQADDILKSIRRTRKRVDVKALRASRARLLATVRRLTARVRKVSRPTKRVLKRVRQIKRTPKRVITRKAKPRKTVRTKTRPRTVSRVSPRVTVRPRVVTRVRPRLPVRISRVSKSPTKSPKVPPVIKIKTEKPLKKGENIIFNGRVRVKGKVKTIQLKSTFNRAVKYMANLVDNTTSRSFDIVSVGVKKVKEINSPASLLKFRIKRKNSLVLTLVEKSKYAIDTAGEKKGLNISKLLKNKTKRKTTKKKKK